MSDKKLFMNRRTFIKASVVTAGALTFTFGLGGLGSSLWAVNNKPMLDFDIIVVGSGGAGLRAAVSAMEANPKARVCVVAKTMPTRCATAMAEGGINGVIDFSKGDSYDLHAFDTVKGGDYLVDQDAVLDFCEEAGRTIHALDYLGMPFSRDDAGAPKARYAGGASKVRCIYSADKTGHIVIQTLFAEALTRGVKFLMDYQLLDIGKGNGALEGVVLRNIRTGEIMPVRAKAVIMASGGYSRVYWNRSSTPYVATGDGPAAALRAGVPMKDPEMTQFHPTGVVHGGVLITEAARGEGGYLVNRLGERFMSRYAKDRMELAPRDIVSRSIESEILAGRAFGEGMEAYVYLDLRHLGEAKIDKDLPLIRHIGKLFEGIDLAKEPMIIRPTAHYCMGGIDVLNYRQMNTLLPGLYAAGEASNVSIHGANRLGGNSLAEASATGNWAGQGAAAYAKGHRPQPRAKICSNSATSGRTITPRLRPALPRQTFLPSANALAKSCGTTWASSVPKTICARPPTSWIPCPEPMKTPAYLAPILATTRFTRSTWSWAICSPAPRRPPLPQGPDRNHAGRTAVQIFPSAMTSAFSSTRSLPWRMAA